MFNPKHNLLEEQFATSGIELNFFLDLVTGGAHSKNKQAKKAEKKQKEYNKKIAELQTDYNAALDKADIANYHTQRDHAYLMAYRDWEYGKQIQDYKFSQVLREYEKSQAIGNQQLGLNAEAQRQAIAAEQGALDDAFTNFAFERQNNLSAAQDMIAMQAINRQSAGLDKLGLDLESASKEVDRLGIGLDRLSKMSDRESLALKVQGTGFDLKDLGIAAASKNLDLRQLGLDVASKDLDLEQIGLDRASKQLDKKGLGFNLLSKQADRQALGFARLGKGLDRQAQAIQLEGIESKRQFGSQAIQSTIDQLLTQNTLQKEAAMVRSLAALGKAELGQAGKSTAKAQQAVMAELHRGLMAMDVEMSGKHKQAAIQMAELNADASLQKSQVGLNLQRIGLEEAGLDLQGQRIGIEEGLIGLQGQQIGLQESVLDRRAQQIELQKAGIGLSARQIGLQKAGIANQVGRVGLAQRELGIQGDRISIAEGRLTAAERGIDLAQAGIDVQRGRIGLDEIGINNAINQAQRDYQFNNEVLRANLNSTIDASIRNVDRIRMQREIADINTTAAMLLEPERVDYVPEPQLPPERQFVARMEAVPGYVPPAQQENLWSAGISTVTGYAATALSIYSGIGALSSAGAGAGASAVGAGASAGAAGQGSTLMSGNVLSSISGGIG